MKINEYTNNLLTRNLAETWGNKLEALNIPEKLQLLKDMVATIGDSSEVEISAESIEAAEKLPYVEEINESDYLQLIKGLSDLLTGYGKSLVCYSDLDWAKEVCKIWGDRLEILSISDHAYLIYQGINNLLEDTDDDYFPHGKELDECAIWMEENFEGAPGELALVARGVANLI